MNSPLLRSVIVLSTLTIIAYAVAHKHARHLAAHNAANPLTTTSPKTITIAQSTDADTLDPSDTDLQPTRNIAKLLWGTLYEVSPEGQLQPYFAQSYHYAEDGRSLTFKLRPDLTCEDGEQFTAKDVAFSFDRAADPKFRFTGNASGFVLPALGYEGARVDDKLTVTLLVKKYNPIAIGLVSELFLMCKAPYERMSPEQASNHVSATGPYRLVEWLHDDRIVLGRNPQYKLPAPSYDQVIWRVIPESSTRSAELIAGDVDIITSVSPDQIDAINASDIAKTISVSSVRRIYVGFNQRDKFSSTAGGKAVRDPAVRTALQYAIDVPTICEALLRTPCQRAATMVVPANDHSGIPAFPYDPDRAERLLDAAGYPRRKDGIRFEVNLQAPRNLYGNGDVALAIGQFLSDIGVKTTVEIMDTSVYLPLVRQKDAGPLYLLGSGGATWSALYDMSDLSSPEAGVNYTSFSDPVFFAGWNALDKSRDDAGQSKIVNQMLQAFHDRGTWLFLYFQPDIYGVSNKLHWKPRADELVTLN